MATKLRKVGPAARTDHNPPATYHHVDQDQGASALEAMRTYRNWREDSWYNWRNKFGGTADPVIISSYVKSRGRIQRHEAETLFEFDWLARRVVDLMARDATRRWIRFSHDNDPDKAEKLRQEDERLNGRGLFAQGIRWARLHGGSVMVLGAWDGQKPDMPLRDIKRVRKLMWAHVVDRWLAFPTDWYRDVEDPNFGHVERYQVHKLSPVGSQTFPVHSSRVIRFDGNPLPPLALVRNWGWHASVLDAVYDALRNWGMSNQAAASVVPGFVTVAMQISNLNELIRNKDWGTIRARLNETAAQMATQNVVMYGDGEQIQKLGTPITGLPDLIDKFMNIVSGATDIPKSILFQAEAGMGGSNAGRTDIDNWADDVQSYQETELRPKIRRWLDIIGVPLGLEPGEVEFEFEPLRQYTPQEESAMYLQNAQADQTYANSGTIDQPERIGIHRFSGQHYNWQPPVFDTTRIEKVVEMVDEQDVNEDELMGAPPGGFPEGMEPGGGEGFDGDGNPNNPEEASQSTQQRDSRGDDVERRVHKPGSRGGHIRGYDKHGNPIYGDPGHTMHGHAKAQQPKPKGKGGGREQLIAAKSEADQKAFAEAEQRGIKLPPAWTNVWVSPNKKADLQATGKDSKGRKQYVYSVDARNRADAKKFARLRQFHKSLPAMQRRIAGDFDTKDEAKVLHLISQTGFRIGSEADTGGDKQAFGASTLRAEHATVDGDSVTFEFTGKKGVQQKHTIRDAGLARHIEQVGEGKLFNTDADKVRTYLKSISGGKDFKVKDFRTYVATEEALKHVKGMPAPDTDAKRKKAVMEVARKVAAKLGNTPQMARDSYIDPTVFKQWDAAQEAA